MVPVENDYCAFMLSTMIELSRTTDFTGAPQFSPEAIAMKLSESHNHGRNELLIDPYALHYGIHLYKRYLANLGYSLIDMYGDDDELKQFYTLKGLTNRGYNLKFPAIIGKEPRKSKSLGELQDSILQTRNSIYKLYNITPPNNCTAASALLALQRESNLPLNSSAPAALTHHFRRKPFLELSEEEKKINVGKFIELIKSYTGEKDYESYLELLCTLDNKKRKKKSSAEERIEAIYNAIKDDPKLKDCLSNIKEKTTSIEEKRQILNLFDSIRKSLETSSGNDVDDTEVVDMTHELMQETKLSYVSKRSIEQLNESRDTILKKGEKNK
jgi:hypothetical protein